MAAPVALTEVQIAEGYDKSVESAFRLLKAAMLLTTEFPDVALGMAELGQEELGKSLSLLAAFSLKPDLPSWQWFWSAWKHHVRKAHRAFLYELIHPRRVELHGPDGAVLSGIASRPAISHEKEAAFYVTFTRETGRFTSPQESVTALEVYNRVFTLLNLAVTAWHVRAALRCDDLFFRQGAFSEVAFRICSEPLMQEDMPELLQEFEARSERHHALVGALRERLAESDRYMRDLAARRAT